MGMTVNHYLVFITHCSLRDYFPPASHVETRHTKLIYISQQKHLASTDNCSPHPVAFLALTLYSAVSVWHIGSSYRCCVEWGIDLERLWARALALPLAKLWVRSASHHCEAFAWRHSLQKASLSDIEANAHAPYSGHRQDSLRNRPRLANIQTSRIMNALTKCR